MQMYSMMMMYDDKNNILFVMANKNLQILNWGFKKEGGDGNSR